MYDDDKTPPTISIVYEGGHYLANLGTWSICIEDLESGIDDVLIQINGIVYVHDQNLGGPLSLAYNNIPLPVVIQTHMIVVTAINNDKDYEWDQETGTETDRIEILEDKTAPFINIVYQGDYNDENPGTWNVNAYDDESGINEATLQILIDNQFAGSELGDYNVPNIPEEHTIYVEVENNDPFNPLFNSTLKFIMIIDDDDVYPVITYTYSGDNTDGNPGEIEVIASDNIGLSVDDSGTYEVPNTLGTHNFLFSATDNDDDRPGDSLTTTLSVSIPIVDDDTTPPIISIIYYGSGFDENPGYYEWNISDTDDGIGGDHDHDSGFSELIIKGKYESTVGLPEEEFLLTPTETGTWNLPTSPGTYTLNITASDNDDDRTLETDARSTSLIQEQTITDDDVTPPSISIQYEGDGNVINPGVWHVEVEDLESGLDEVEFLIGDAQYLYDQDLVGKQSKSYDIPVPDTVGEHILSVVAKDNDKDWNGDQEASTDSNVVNIILDDDTTGPIISVNRYVKRYEHPSGEWRVFIEDLESGLDEIIIEVDGNVHIHDTNLNGIISLSYYNILIPGEVGVHPITITAKNNDKDYTGDQEISTYLDSYTKIPTIIALDDDFTNPTISIVYEGGNIETNPGVWHIDVEDLESGLAGVLILVDGISVIDDQSLGGTISAQYDVLVPAIAGIHTITFTAKNNDIGDSGVQEIYTRSHIVDIEPSAILPPDDDTTGPTIDINYVENGYGEGKWRVYIEDIESGLDRIQILIDGIEYVNDQNLNGMQSKMYQFWVLATIELLDTGEGLHTIEVVAVNNDKDYAGDEEISTAFDPMCVDDTDPTISITYSGSGYDFDPGWWNIYISDLESGIDEVKILINGFEYLHDQNLDGIQSISYEGDPFFPLGNGVPVPGSRGTHDLTVIAYNNDKDCDGDQESNTLETSVVIETLPQEEPADDIPPIINQPEDIAYEYMSTGNKVTWIASDEYPYTYTVLLDGEFYEDGIWISGVPVEIDVDGLFLGSYQFSIEFYDTYANYAVDNVNVVVTEDDDTTGPIISPYYVGSATDFDPGWWSVQIEDLESGLDEVLVLVNGFEIDYQNLDGQLSISYTQIETPVTLDCYWFKVITTNYDIEWTGDQERNTYLDVVKITHDPILGPGTTPSEYGPPFITIDYDGESFENNPGVWNVIIEDLDNGIKEVQISIDGEIYFYQENLDNIFSITYSDIPVPSTLGVHKIEVDVIDNQAPDAGQIVGGEANTDFLEINIIATPPPDETPPTITVTYDGAGHENDPGVWHVIVEDLESGLGEVQIVVDGIEILFDDTLNGIAPMSYDIPVSSMRGYHTINVTAKNDINYDGDQETSKEGMKTKINAYIPPLPPPEPPPPVIDTTPPIIDQPGDIAYEYTSTGNIITWIAEDEHPDTYTVLLDGGLYESGTWESGSPIEISVDGLEIGTYEFMIRIYDTYDNYAEDIVIVVVTDETPP
ncbi:hypothetical protein ES705_18884 [subsurface metagenome]